MTPSRTRRLALDLDGCVFDTAAALGPYFRDLAGEPKLDRYDWGDAEAMRLAVAAVDFAALSVYPGFADAVRLLYAQDVQLDFATSRPFGLFALTELSLGRALGRPVSAFGDLWLCGRREKVDLLLELGDGGDRAVDTVVDDCPFTVCKARHHGLRAIVFDQPWNRDLGDAYERVTSWTGKGGLTELVGMN
jgi:hypothetical protein